MRVARQPILWSHNPNLVKFAALKVALLPDGGPTFSKKKVKRFKMAHFLACCIPERSFSAWTGNSSTVAL
jgi:hypothetical protein